MKVLIPSARNSSQNLIFGNMPPVAHPVAGKLFFDVLQELYGDLATSYKIALGDRYEYFEKYVSRNARGIMVEYIRLERLGDLGYTIYSLIENEDDSIIINFADTLVLDDFKQINGDVFFYAYEYNSDLWTFFETDKGTIDKIYDKKSLSLPHMQKMFVGVFKIENVKLFKSILEQSIYEKDGIDSFYLALKEYSNQNSVNFVEAKKWYDLGHYSKSLHTKAVVRSRIFNNIDIDYQKNRLKKTSSNYLILRDEIKWYLELPSKLSYLIPRVFDYSLSISNTYIDLEYHPFNTLHELYIFGNLDYQAWIAIFGKLRAILNEFNNYEFRQYDSMNDYNQMYIYKTLTRLNQIKSTEDFGVLFSSPFYVNGKKFHSLEEQMEIIKTELLSVLKPIETYAILHGDFCFSNILIDDSFSLVKLIDPRGVFGKTNLYGDCRYDLAKLLHSFDGKYDNIISDRFELEYSIFNGTPYIEYHFDEINVGLNIYQCFETVFAQEIKKHSISALKTIESLLFFSMIPLHSDNIKRQLVMLGTAVELFSSVFNNAIIE
jgi:hypothetical protein